MTGAVANRSILIPQFDRRSVTAYSLFALMLCMGLVVMLARGFSISPIKFGALPLSLLWILSAGLLRRVNWPRLATWLECNAILYALALPAIMLLAPAASFSLPLVDDQLAAIDQALGFNWVATVYALQPYLDPLRIAYFSISWQPPLVTATLAVYDPAKSWLFVAAGITCAIVTALIFVFTPAYGAFVHYGITPADYPPFTPRSMPWGWIRQFDALRSGERYIDGTMSTALVAFPSYHAAVAALCVWAIWPFRYLRLPMALLNLGLLAGALVFGTHHLIDLIAGIALAAISVLVLKKPSPRVIDWWRAKMRS